MRPQAEPRRDEWGYTSLVVVDVDGGGDLGWIRGYEW